ncbi:MAG: Holliday junction branch migration protein RuvA [bacterium]|nr:Holliday junction branch migration protein RuvA [bacterium]
MITRLEGVLAEKTLEEVVIDVNGVGYEVRVPLSTFFELPDPGKLVRLRIHTHVREDAFQLFGFLSDSERGVFRLLLGISGVGPRLALGILGGLPVDQLLRAIRGAELATLVAIPGVGKKTAERIIVDLRDSLGKLEEPPVRDDAPPDAQQACLSALLNLGYARNQAERAVRAALETLPEAPPLEVLIKEALRVAAG